MEGLEFKVCVCCFADSQEASKQITLGILLWASTRAQAGRTRMFFFFQELKDIISSVLSEEKYTLLGDFSAHIGSRESADEE